MHTLKIDVGVFANISQGKNGKELVRILLKIWSIINDLQNFADFIKMEAKRQYIKQEKLIRAPTVNRTRIWRLGNARSIR